MSLRNQFLFSSESFEDSKKFPQNINILKYIDKELNLNDKIRFKRETILEFVNLN